MSAGRYKHSRDSVGQARQERARAKRDQVRVAMLARRKVQRAAQRALRGLS